MPIESVALESYPRAALQRGRLVDDALVFEIADGLGRALADGFFLLQMPADFSVSAMDAFCANFFKPADDGSAALTEYRGFRDRAVPGDYQGYFDREHDQWENFYVERANWGVLPEPVAAEGAALVGIGIAVLRSILRSLAIPERSWQQVTGGLAGSGGHRMLAFNHFRSEKKTRGCKFHRDSGWVTVLRSIEPGLVALISDELQTIWPEDGHLIVNFGSSIEVLTAHLPTPVRASVHGVVQTEREQASQDRLSYVAFLDSDLTADIFEMRDGEPQYVEAVAEFAVREVARTYDDDNAHL
ncbi:2OG-Fe(II) oxygenase family protein [Jatrophihabitans lederbergiae]|uniref:2OG-Fe(II) oxygenase family protein n=1 Tax=Jatrophihabitans lederbergiae TaxID=3075547 RepID=A0ABU2JG18_9ACTN|nr:2OG-Fe(II) oxygenase family protein [Jatrophihabitans sp. DSM 44399]MDT0263921.1 2OG-Fe(II) oxygenase family protein [Jatrophihabitans sp. DSM 44399]